MRHRMIGDGMEVISDAGSLNDAVQRVYGSEITILEKRPVTGGDINEAYFLILSNGQKAFLKENTKDNAGFFKAEASGLEALSQSGKIGVPSVHAYGTYEKKSFLLMDCLEAGRMKKSFWEDFGHSLAAVHKSSVAFLYPEKKYGFTDDNYIGAGFQKNTWNDSWIGFFRDCRILPQLNRAKRMLPAKDIARIERLMEHLDEYLIEPDQPSLLHGDLWSGNFVVGPDGKSWLIDPAAYIGNAEADIAMTELFGGFSEAFYFAYRESGLLQQGYEDRRDIYNLYHLLNHLNSFGESYLYAVEHIITRF